MRSFGLQLGGRGFPLHRNRLVRLSRTPRRGDDGPREEREEHLMIVRAPARLATLLGFLVAASLMVRPAAAATSSFAAGDVFVGVGGNHVQWRLPDGTLNKTMTTA